MGLRGASPSDTVLMVADLASPPPVAVRLLPIDVSRAAHGVWSLGGMRISVPTNAAAEP